MFRDCKQLRRAIKSLPVITRCNGFNLLAWIHVIACYTIIISRLIHRSSRIVRISIDDLPVSHGSPDNGSAIIDRRPPTVRRLSSIRIPMQHVPLVIILARLPRTFLLVRSNEERFRNFARNPIFLRLILDLVTHRCLRHDRRTVNLGSRRKNLIETRPPIEERVLRRIIRRVVRIASSLVQTRCNLRSVIRVTDSIVRSRSIRRRMVQRCRGVSIFGIPLSTVRRIRLSVVVRKR